LTDRIGRYQRGGGDAFWVGRRSGGEFQRIQLDSIRFETLLGWCDEAEGVGFACGGVGTDGAGDLGRGMGEAGGEQGDWGERGEERLREEGDGVRVMVGCNLYTKET
jgi:hypothetical protein